MPQTLRCPRGLLRPEELLVDGSQRGLTSIRSIISAEHLARTFSLVIDSPVVRIAAALDRHQTAQGDRVKRGLPGRGGRADTDHGARGAPAGLGVLPPGGFGVGLVSVETAISGRSPALSLSTPPQTSGIINATVVLENTAQPSLGYVFDGGRTMVANSHFLEGLFVLPLGPPSSRPRDLPEVLRGSVAGK